MSTKRSSIVKFIHHQQKHLFGLMVIVFLCSCASGNHADEPEAFLSPPTLVSCASEATCDRDPEHLKKFLDSFYYWYNRSENELTDLLPPQFKTEQPKFQKKLEPYFEPETFRKLYPPVNPTSDDPDVIDDPSLCANDFFYDDGTVLSARSLIIQRNRAFFAVSIGFSDDPSADVRPDLTRVVILKPQAGHWVIDMISCPG